MPSNLSPLFRNTALALTAAITLGGCGLVDQAGGDDLSDGLSFSFERVGGQGYMDQTLSIVNEERQSLVINADVEAVDASGDALLDVRVEFVYGSMAANMVIAPGENIDLLVFDGPGTAAVDDVRVTRLEATPVDASAWPTPVDAIPLDDDERPLDYPADFSKIALRNPNDESTDVRVVAIIWDNPETGQPQQAQEVIDLSQLITVPREGKIVVAVDRSTQEAIAEYANTNAVSLKAHYSL